ncbi:MAG TPA: FtsX-like permease family protein [Pseudonocardiaceae bacterium]|nr:FtsX-like permease family protein [Pseudonocardiaceae bacterium]
MSAVRLWGCRLLRRRWRSVIVLSLLVALTGGVAIAAIIGARRSTVVVAETLHERRQPDVISIPARPGFDWSRIVALPYVEAYGFFASGGFCIEETGSLEAPDALFTLPPAGGGMYDTIMRIDAVEGRTPTGPREIAINRIAQQKYGWRIGRRLLVSGVATGQLDAYWNRAKDTGRTWGPMIEVTVVGIFAGDDAWRVITAGVGGPGVALSTSFLATYRDRFDYRVDAVLRLRGGDADVPRLHEDIGRIMGDDTIPISNVNDAKRRLERTTTVEAVALVLFAAALLAATFVLVGQALFRLVRAGADAGDVLPVRAMGMATPAVVVGLAIPGLAVAGLGALGALGVALAMSLRVPIGMAGTFELHPGVKVDPPVLAAGVAGLAAFTALAALAAAFLAVRELTAARDAGSSRAGRPVGLLPVPLTIGLGVRFALERRPGHRPAASRAALVGAVVGVLGVVAAWTVTAGIDDAIAHPERGGQTWDLEFDKGLSDQVITGDPDIAAATELYRAEVKLGGRTVMAYSARPIGTPTKPVIISGRLPDAADEIAIGPATAERLNLRVGDQVPAGRQGSRPVRVVGTTFLLEYAGYNAYDEGLLATPAGLERLEPTGNGLWFYLIDVREGADPGAVRDHLRKAGGMLRSWLPPAGVAMLDRLRGLPVLLGSLLALLGVGTVGHALVSSARRRRGEFAVLRALGLSGRQVRAVIMWQAATLAAVAVVFGVPLGTLAGLLAWRGIATSMPLIYVRPLAVLATALVVPATVIAVYAMAVWPARAAGRAQPARILRAE